MRRRDFLLRTMAGSAGALVSRGGWAAALRPAQTQPSATFSEAVMIDAVTADGSQEVAVRLERFPERERGALCVMTFVGDEVYAVVDDDLDLGGPPTRTRVEAPRVSFEISGALISEFTRTIEGESVTGTVHVSALAHPTMEPPLGVGTSPLLIEATFKAWHLPVALRQGRTEVMGQVHAKVHTLKGAHDISTSGHWHERVGDRPRVAPRFTCLTAQGQNIGVLAVERAAGVYGYAWVAGKVAMVRGFEIDPRGPARRSFRLDLDDGQTITGTAEVRREHSVPIDGRRRPGSTVVAATNVGPMAGHLNDWEG